MVEDSLASLAIWSIYFDWDIPLSNVKGALPNSLPNTALEGWVGIGAHEAKKEYCLDGYGRGWQKLYR